MTDHDIEMSHTANLELNQNRTRSSSDDDKGPEISTTTPTPVKRFAKDEAVLARFGKKQQLRRGFGLLPIIGLTSTLMITWEAVTATLVNGLEDGGPAGLIYGYLFVWFGSFLQTLVMAEMASMHRIPLAGGPFNWVAILAPPWCKKFLSYLAGWLTVIAWQALVAGIGFVSGTMIQGLLILNYPEYIAQQWHATLLFYAVLSIALFINTYLGRVLPQIESLMLFFHIMGFCGILIPILYLAPHQDAMGVFTTFMNLGGWKTNFLSICVGLLTAMEAFPGLDAADHIAEEIQDAPRVIPLSMGVSNVLNGAMGFIILLALLFCMPNDVNAVLNDITLFPFIGIFQYAVGSQAGGTALTCIIVVTEVFATVGALATASRMLWAFARERGLPGSQFLARVDGRTMLPLWAIGATTLINFLLAVINIGSTVAFSAFLSLIVASYYSSFILSAAVMLHKRLTTPDADINWGPFRLGKWGVPVTVGSLAYSILGTFFSMWPVANHPNLESMNFCVGTEPSPSKLENTKALGINLPQATPQKSRPQDSLKHSKTPVSASKRYLLDAFATPMKNKSLNGQGGRTPSSVSKLHFSTPSFLRRDSQRIRQLPAVNENDDGPMLSPEMIRVPRKPLVRGLSSMLAGLRRMEEEAADEDLEALYEMENEMAGITSKPAPNPKLKPVLEEAAVLVEDSQPGFPLGGFDDEAKFDSEPEEVKNPTLGRDGRPLKAYKKKGQKRTTRRVNMKPVRSKSSALNPIPADEDSDDELVAGHVEAIPETQGDDMSGFADARNFDSDTQSEYTASEGGTRYKRPDQSKKRKVMGRDGKIKIAARKVTALANQNFKRLKLRNSGAKGGAAHNSRFRRRK
ncbi:hypothetical protein G7Y89_g7543 [Cudoniella acicularis]|uniref:Amino acid permease/ SLC12A domain-containing protein n=1 Tax=Cudoniella acicularis TaxID=354080 RepID=A0A8H4RKK8_9HELO|nr:hypothetical protein G7Y89_g7543 [Cudoniella acicularis]